MLTNRLVHLVAKLSLGKELAMALMLLRLILEALEKKNVRNVALFVFKQLPAAWRHPEGPATEAEFLDVIQAGEAFVTKVRALLRP